MALLIWYWPFTGEKAPQPLGTDVSGDVFQIRARAGFLQCRFVDVSARSLIGVFAAMSPRNSSRQMAREIDLLAGGAPRHPRAKGEVGGAILEEGGKDRGSQRLEGDRVAEEAGHANEAILIQRFQLGGIVLKAEGVVLQPFDAAQPCAVECAG